MQEFKSAVRFSNLPQNHIKQINSSEKTEKPEGHKRCSSLMLILGKGVISTQARRLDSHGLSYEELLYLRQSTDCNNDFAQLLHKKRVNSQPLRVKNNCYGVALIGDAQFSIF